MTKDKTKNKKLEKKESNERKLMIEAKNGNSKALEELILKNDKLIWSIIRRFLYRGYEKEDLYQIGVIGFIKAIKRFDMKYEYKLSTFAVPYIMGEIKKFFRDDGIIKVSRSIKELKLKINEIQKIYLNKTGKNIDTKKLSKILKTSEENIYIALESSKSLKSINDEAFEDGNDEKSSRILVSKVDEQSKIIDKISLNNIIENLNLRDKKIIKLRYYNGKTQSEVAKIIGVSQVQISRIERRILKEMREKMA